MPRDEIIYFGIERNVNTGTANVGFWFLQDEVGCTSTGGAVSFTGAHLDGDLLVVSEFSGGGTVSTINAYRWDRPSLASPGSLNPVPIAAGVDCRNASLPAGDATCGAANTGTITTPWLTAQKTTVGNTLGTALFFEAGLNLTKSGLGGKCFSTFLGDTRSSTSLTATLFDFSGGTLGKCESGVVTTPSAGKDGSAPIGANGTLSVTDSAVLTVSGADHVRRNDDVPPVRSDPARGRDTRRARPAARSSERRSPSAGRARRRWSPMPRRSRPPANTAGVRITRATRPQASLHPATAASTSASRSHRFSRRSRRTQPAPLAY